MACIIGSARANEKGGISGGKAGDQTGAEVASQSWYLHSKGWVVIRAKDAATREKIAYAMKAICDNNNIGYDQPNRLGLFNAVKSLGYDPAKCTVKTSTDCSEGVRVCVHYAGITCKDFNTASELTVLKSTGKFDVFTDDKYCKSSDYLLKGDILVTKTKGHTVVVLTDGAKANVSTTTTTVKKPTVAKPTIKKGSSGTQVKLLQQDLNYLGIAKLTVDGSAGTLTQNAIIAFQKKYGLTADGVYGKNSYNKMVSLLK